MGVCVEKVGASSLELKLKLKTEGQEEEEEEWNILIVMCGN